LTTNIQPSQIEQSATDPRRLIQPPRTKNKATIALSQRHAQRRPLQKSRAMENQRCAGQTGTR
jgi:hypothetical protein